MDKSELNKEIANSEVIVHEGRYAYLKCDKQILGDHFLISKDDDEVTIVTEEKNVGNVLHEKTVKWFKLFEIKITKPFICVGFLAAITEAIANKGLNVLVVSTFSKDYILIKEEDEKSVIEILKNRGFSVNGT